MTEETSIPDANEPEDPQPDRPSKQAEPSRNSSAIGVGIALGVAFGVVFDNLAVGIAIGVALGAAFSRRK